MRTDDAREHVSAGALRAHHLMRQNGLRIALPLVAAVLLLLVSNIAHAAMSFRPATTGYANEIGVSLSYGVKPEKDSWFWGYAPDYIRVINEKWLINVSLAYDKDTEPEEMGRKVTESWTPSVILGYQLNPRVAVGAGLGHGLIDNKDGAGWNSVKLGDDLTGALALAVTIWSKGRQGLALSVSLEHNISDNVASISTDLGYGWGF